MEILVDKSVEYIHKIDSEAAGDIVQEISKQYAYLVDQSLQLVSQNQVLNRGDDSQVKRLVQQKDKEIHDLTV